MKPIVRSTLVVLSAFLVGAAKCYGQAPTADDVFRRYVAASGGEAAIRAVTTRVMTGDLVTGAGRAPLEIMQAAPNRFLRTIDSPVSGRSENGFDGVTGWTRNQRGTRDVAGPELGMLLRELHLNRPLSLRGFYSLVTAPRPDSVDGRAVYSIVGTTADSVTETLYFDRESGLLTGWDVSLRGTILRTRLEDFRNVDAVTLAFRVKHARDDFAWSDEIRRIEQNITVDSARFVKPRP
jgi:hypothetical protein